MTIYLWTWCFVLFSKAQHRTRGASHPSFLIILTRLKAGILFLSPILSPPLENKFALSRFSGWNELMLKRNDIADNFRWLVLLLHLTSQRGDVFLERAFCRKNHLHLQQVSRTSTHNHEHPLLSENPSEPHRNSLQWSLFSLLHLAACLSLDTWSRWDSGASHSELISLRQQHKCLTQLYLQVHTNRFPHHCGQPGLSEWSGKRIRKQDKSGFSGDWTLKR